MDIENRIFFKRDLNLCELGPLGEEDVTGSYVKGLQKQKSYIQNIHVDINLEKQKSYVKKIRLSKKDCIFGLFVNGSLMGTSGVQNITGPEVTTIGIFVFDKDARGKGYGKTLVWATSYLLKETLGCSQFSAGMEKINIPSFKSFNVCGYNILSETKDVYIMKAKATDLIVPGGISQIEILSIK